MAPVVIPEIDQDRCDLCGECVSACPQGAVSIVERRVVVDVEACAYCGDCEDLCPNDAIALPYWINVPRSRNSHEDAGNAS